MTGRKNDDLLFSMLFRATCLNFESPLLGATQNSSDIWPALDANVTKIWGTYLVRVRYLKSKFNIPFNALMHTSILDIWYFSIPGED